MANKRWMRREEPSPLRRRLLGTPRSSDPRFHFGYWYAGRILGGQGSYAPDLRSAARAEHVPLDDQRALRILGMDEDKLLDFLEEMQDAYPAAFAMSVSKRGESYWKLVPSEITYEMMKSAKLFARNMGVKLEG